MRVHKRRARVYVRMGSNWLRFALACSRLQAFSLDGDNENSMAGHDLL